MLSDERMKKIFDYIADLEGKKAGLAELVRGNTAEPGKDENNRFTGTA